MKMHRLLAEAASTIAKSVFREGKVLDHELATAFDENPKWGKRDRNFIAETVFEVIRWRRALGFLVDSEETTALCAAQWVRMGYELPDWWKYNGRPQEEIISRQEALAEQPRKIRESVPDWIDELGEAELGPAWDDEIAALNERAAVYLRVNRLKTTKEKAVKWLADEGVQVSGVPGVPDALVLAPGKMLPKPLRQDGRIEIQDAGSQIIAPMVGPKAGERIIDACSGAGGKALHLAALMNGDGRVFSMDVDAKKLKELERRASRAGASCVKAKLIMEDTAEDFKGIADRLLIDAPCSGLGTLKRQPDLKWRLKPAALERVRSIQSELLDEYPKMLKPGGTLVYATCSVLPSENRGQVDKLLAGGGFDFVEDRVISPAKDGFDGFYAAVLVKKGV
jgi:16S rRNA (cytosine967-C5)-methyltransferase